MRKDDESVYHFPAAAIRRDPILARAPDNQLFQFFCRWKDRPIRRFIQTSLVWIAGFVVFIPFPSNPLNALSFTQLLILMGPFFLVPWIPVLIRKSFQPRKRADRFGAASLAELFHDPQLNAASIADLWLCGVRGSDLAEAIYLESRKHDIQAILPFGIICSIGGAVGILARTGCSHVSDWFLPLAVIIGGILLTEAFLNGVYISGRQKISMFERAIKSYSPVPIPWAVSPGAFLITLAATAAAAITLSVTMQSGPAGYMDPNQPGVLRTRILLSAAMIGAGVAARYFKTRFRAVNLTTQLALLSCYDKRFDDFVRTEFLGEEMD